VKKYFYIGLLGLLVFEVLKVYFIMPFPGSQEINSLDVAYLFHSYRWIFRVFFGLMILAGIVQAFRIKHKWIPAIVVVVVAFCTYVVNFVMTAESIFKQPQTLIMKGSAENKVKSSSLVIGVEHNGIAKAYPIQFLIYHHQVQDNVGGKPIIATYCSVCRTGRVFEPIVNGKHELFRLVGMDHYNAMFEDATTHSWWRQVNGECVAGELKGTELPEVTSSQLTLDKWFELYPHGTVMQPDGASMQEYDPSARFEQGKSEGNLTRTDTLSWENKSWVIGIQIDTIAKAYDWNQLKQQHIMHDDIGQTPIVLVLGSDGKSFAAFERPSKRDSLVIRNDTLFLAERKYDFSGRNLQDSSLHLTRVQASQEFWHSWRTFHPHTGH
jgi:hypothetical protein